MIQIGVLALSVTDTFLADGGSVIVFGNSYKGEKKVQANGFVSELHNNYGE
jgi:hypothetical protein